MAPTAVEAVDAREPFAPSAWFAIRAFANAPTIKPERIPTDPIFSNLKCGGLDNRNKGFVTLVNGRRTITCTVELVQDRNDLQKQVGINLLYNVLDNKETKVLVKHLAEE